MNIAMILGKEKIVTLSQLQKNPAKALNAEIVRIVKNGKEIGIFFTKDEFEDLIEENLPLHPDFKKKLDKSLKKVKKIRTTSLKDIL